MTESLCAIPNTVKAIYSIQDVNDWDPNLIRVVQFEGDVRMLLSRVIG